MKWHRMATRTSDLEELSGMEKPGSIAAWIAKKRMGIQKQICRLSSLISSCLSQYCQNRIVARPLLIASDQGSSIEHFNPSSHHIIQDR